MSKSVILYETRSVAEQSFWGQESFLAGGEPSFCDEICPCALQLLNVLSPKFVSPFFMQTAPAHARLEPQRDRETYWRAVHGVLASIPPELPLASKLFEKMKQIIADQLSVAAQTYLRDVEVVTFAQCFLNMPERELRDVPDVVRHEVQELHLAMHERMLRDPPLAQRASETLLFALAAWEQTNRYLYTRDTLRFPAFLPRFTREETLRIKKLTAERKLDVPDDIRPFTLGDGMLMVGAQRFEKQRERFYDEWVPRFLRALPFEEFDARCKIVRNDPLMIMSMLAHFPARFPGAAFETQFVEAVYKGLPVPHDVGQQALVFGCSLVATVWFLKGWPLSRVVRRRLVRLARSGAPNDKPWRLSSKDLADVVYRNFI